MFKETEIEDFRARLRIEIAQDALRAWQTGSACDLAESVAQIEMLEVVAREHIGVTPKYVALLLTALATRFCRIHYDTMIAPGLSLPFANTFGALPHGADLSHTPRMRPRISVLSTTTGDGLRFKVTAQFKATWPRQVPAACSSLGVPFVRFRGKFVALLWQRQRSEAVSVYSRKWSTLVSFSRSNVSCCLKISQSTLLSSSSKCL